MVSAVQLVALLVVTVYFVMLRCAPAIGVAPDGVEVAPPGPRFVGVGSSGLPVLRPLSPDAFWFPGCLGVSGGGSRHHRLRTLAPFRPGAIALCSLLMLA